MATVELPGVVIASVTGPVLGAPLVVINRSPEPDETSVPLATAIELELAVLGSDALDVASIEVLVDDRVALRSGVLEPSFAGLRASLLLRADGARITLDPLTPLASEALVRVRVRASTLARIALDDTWTFVAEDRTAPRLVAAIATGPTSVRVSFDEPMAIVTGSAFELVPMDAPAVPVRVVGSAATGTLIDLTTDVAMSPGRRYELRVADVEDVAGNPIAPPFDRAFVEGWAPSRPSARRFDLWSMLPKHNRRADAGDLRAFIACLQEVVDMMLATVDRMVDAWDIERASPSMLARILIDLGNPFAIELDEREQRRLAASLVHMYQLKGTARGIREAVAFFLGLDVEILPYTATTLVLGESELGVDWELGPSDRFARYAFDVQVERALSPHERELLREIVDYLKPAHTHFVELIEPEPEIVPDHWSLGDSDLDETTLLH